MKVSGSYGAHQGSSSPGGNMNLHNQASYTASSKKQLLLSWVNSIEYPNCLLASEISEFRDGVIFCEIVNEIILMNTKPDFLTQVKMNNITYQDSLRNLEMALAEIRSIRNKRPSQKIADLKSQDLANNDEKILDLLEYLYAIAHGSPIIHPQEPRMIQNAPTSNPKFQTSNQRLSDSQHVPSNIQHSPTSSYVQPSDPLRNMAPAHQSHLRNAASVPLPHRAAKLEQGLPMKNENISISNSEYSHYSPKSNQAENQRNSFSQANPSQEPPKYYHYLGGKQQNYEEQNNQIPQQQVSFNQHYYSQNNPNEPGNYTANQFDNSIPENRAPVPQNLYTNPEKVEMDGPRSTRKTDKTLPAQSSSQIYQTPTAAGQKKGSQVRNASAGFNLDSQQTPITDHSYSQSPHAAGAPGEGRHSLQNRFSAKLTSHSQTPQKPVLTEESKHSANFLQQRIEELKETKRQSLNQKQTGSRDLTPVKKIENTSGLKSSIMETKLFLESQKPSDKTMVTPVIEQTKTKVIHWLVSITLLKENIRNIEKTLPKICKNGLLFIDLINRLEGKHETIKSAYRNPGTKTQIASNYKQVLNFLGRFEKMNPRYLLATQELAEGDEDVFWGLLDDMWHLYNKKISPYDSRYAKDDQYQTLSTNPFRGFERTISYSDIIYADRSRMDTSHAHVTSPLRTRSKSPSEYGTQEKVQKSGIEYNSNEPLHEVSDIADRESRFESNRTGQATNEGYQSGHSLKNSIRSDHEAPRKSIIKKGEASKFFSQSFHDENVMTNVDTSPHNGEHASHTQGESEVLDWLKHMGFKSMLMRKKTSLIDDPFRNGTLLCYIVGRVENERMHSLYKDPKTVDECRHNVYYCFQVLARRQTPIPVSLKGKEEEVLKGDESITLALLYSLMKISQNKADLNTSVLNNTFKSIKQEASVYIPPYDDSQKTRLEESLVRWVYSLGLFRETPTQPKTFKELTILMRTGVLLCDITALVTNQKITLIQRRPTNELQCIANIRKALEILRQNKTMGQKYLWKEKEIYLGNSSIILGILEDLRRLFDGLPPRNQANYFATGPYIPAEPKITLEEREVSDKLQYIPDRSRLLTSATFSPQAASSRRRQSTEDVRSPNGRRLEKSPSQNYREQASKLNLSSDEPISIVDYERANLKNSYNSTTPTNANVEIYMNTNESRWLGSNQGSLYTSPKAAAGRRLTSEDIFRGEKNNDQNLYKSTSPKGFYLDDKRSMYASSGFQQSQKSSMVSPRGSDLKEWIITLGFGPQTKDVDFDAPFIEDLKDGVLLCKVIEALELKELPGVILKPRTNASRILNIRKCLKILEKRQNVNPFSLNLEDQIVAGDGPAIRKIFNIIRESYKFMDNCVQKTQSPNASRFLETMRSGRSVASTKSDKLSKSTERWALYRPHENYILSPKEREKSIIKPKYSKS